MRFLVPFLLLAAACSHDWDKLDPRVDGGGASQGGNNAGGASNTGAATTGGAAAGGGTTNTGGAGGVDPCAACEGNTPFCDPTPTPTCVECLQPDNCFGSQDCVDNKCCEPLGNECQSSNDCCNGEECSAGVCGPGNCTPNGSNCMMDGQCCSDNCSGGECRAPGQGGG